MVYVVNSARHRFVKPVEVFPVSPRPPRVPLTPERIVHAAVALIDRTGVDGFTMRLLGAELGVEAMAIYKHLPSKQAVLDGVIHAVLAELDDGLPRATGGTAALGELARRHRALERRHPGAYALLAGMPASAYTAARPLVESVLASLERDGFSPVGAARALRVVVRFAIGFTLTRPLAPADAGRDDPLSPILAHLTDPAEEDALFEDGLAALLAGLRP